MNRLSNQVDYHQHTTAVARPPDGYLLVYSVTFIRYTSLYIDAPANETALFKMSNNAHVRICEYREIGLRGREIFRVYGNDASFENDTWEASRYMVMGVMAHQSALRDGETLDVPDFGDAPE